MIRKYAGQMQLVCDECSAETPEFDDDQFEAMISAAKADGWSITRPEGHWKHECDECAGSNTGSALAAARRKFGLA